MTRLTSINCRVPAPRSPGSTVGDAIDLTGVGVADNYSFDGSTLTLKLGSTDLGSVNLSGLPGDTQFGVADDGHGGTTITEIPTVTITVVTPDGMDFQHHDVLVQMGRGTIQPGGNSTSFTILDGADHRQFVVDGSGFTFGNDGAVTGGTISSFHEFTTDPTPVALSDFTGLSVDAVAWIHAVQQAAQGNSSAIDALTSGFAYNFVGNSGDDTFGSPGHADTLLGGPGNDNLDPGGAPSGSHDTVTGGAGSDTFVYGLGYGAVTITDFDQGNSGGFDVSEHDKLEINGFSGDPNPSITPDGNGNSIVDFGNGDVLTLLGVADAGQIPQSDIVSGGGNNNGGNNGPAISNAGNTVDYTGMAVFLDQSIAVSDPTGIVDEVNAWISSGFQIGDILTINGSPLVNGSIDGNIVESGHTIHYHYDNTISHTIDLTSGTATLADFDAALQLIQFSSTSSDPTAGGTDTSRTITWAAHDSASATSPTVTTTVDIVPVLNSFTLTVTEGGNTVLSDSNFSVSQPVGYGFLLAGARLRQRR